jgi:hypothetical protein
VSVKFNFGLYWSVCGSFREIQGGSKWSEIVVDRLKQFADALDDVWQTVSLFRMFVWHHSFKYECELLEDDPPAKCLEYCRIKMM